MLLGITKDSIIKIIISDDKNEEILQKNNLPNNKISEIYKIPNDKIITKESKYSDLNQYFNIYELSNNKILIHSYSSEILISICGAHAPVEICKNIIYILDLNNFKIIHNFKSKEKETYIVVLNKFICFCYNNSIYIYDISDYTLLRKIKDGIRKRYIIKYWDDNIIAMGELENNNDLLIYNLLNIKNIKFKKYRFIFYI